MNAHITLEELLQRFSTLERDTELRQFACWVAAQTNPSLPSHQNILATISRELEAAGQVSKTCIEIREEFRGTATAAGTVGMNHAPQSASSFLACYSCTDADPFKAASKAVNYTCRWYQAANGSEDDEVFTQRLADKLEAMWNQLN